MAVPKCGSRKLGGTLRSGGIVPSPTRSEILLGGGHRLDWATTYPFAAMAGLWPGVDASVDDQASRGDVTIGSDVWLGSGCLILSGVTIGHGAVIGAHAVVSRDVPPYAVVVGNPGRVVRSRFDPGLVAGLLETAWWELDPATIRPLVPLLQSDRVAELIAAARAARAAGVAGAA